MKAVRFCDAYASIVCQSLGRSEKTKRSYSAFGVVYRKSTKAHLEQVTKQTTLQDHEESWTALASFVRFVTTCGGLFDGAHFIMKGYKGALRLRFRVA